MKTALTIAGSDSSGGAGIQADIKTMAANGVFAMSAITALTAQNTTGVTGIFETTPEFLAAQLDAVFTDIYPDAVKIGMVSSAPLIRTIAERLRFYEAKHIVVDPVMVATSAPGCCGTTPCRPSRSSCSRWQRSSRPTSRKPRSFRPSHHRRRRDGSRRPEDQRAVRLFRPLQGRAQGQRCRRPALAERQREVVPWGAHPQPQHPWHRLHPVQRHCLQSAKGYDLDTRSSGPRNTFPAVCPPCWTSAKVPAP